MQTSKMTNYLFSHTCVQNKRVFYQIMVKIMLWKKVNTQSITSVFEILLIVKGQVTIY